MRELEKRVHPQNHLVTSWGSFGKCGVCTSAVQSTASIDGKRVCEDCKVDKYPEITTAVFVESDAKFCCPALVTCGTKNLSLRQFWVGTCCENASKGTHLYDKYEKLSIVNKIYEEAREDEGSAQRELCKAEDNLEDAKKAAEAANEKLLEKKIWRRKVQKRALVLAADAMVEDETDTETDEEEYSDDDDYEEDESSGEEEERISSVKCKICFLSFAEDNQEAAIVACGHKACFVCLLAFMPNCPFCEKEYSNGQILKLFSN